MALVNDDQVEEVRTVLTEHVSSCSGKCLVDAKAHIPALAGVIACDFVSSITEGSEHLSHWVIDQNIAVG
ncbi:hypothetical protein D3C77_307800 [compost metagenome]